MTGFIKLHRKLLENPVFKNPELLQLFLYCLLRASHKPIKMYFGDEELEIGKGQFITGRFELAKDLHQNESSTYKRLVRLKNLHMVALKSNNKNTLVTVQNWDIYQSINNELDNVWTEEGQQNNNKITTKEQQSNNKVTHTRSKECKNEKNVKNEKKKDIKTYSEQFNDFTDNEELKNTLFAFYDMREKQKPKMTDYAVKLMLIELNKITEDTDIQIKVLEQSILKGYKGIFPLKDNQYKQVSSNPFLELLQEEGKA